MTHARLRQIADKALAACGEVDFYERHEVPERDEKLAAAKQGWQEAREELLAVLA